MADKNFAPRDEPLHVRRFDVVCIEQVPARPNHRRGAVAEAAELFALELRRMLQVIDAVINIALARAALEKNRDREELLALFDGAKQARCRDFSYVPLAVQIFVVPFAGTGKVWVDVQFIAIDADFAFDNGLAARMVGKAEGDSDFGGHHKFFPSTFKPYKSSQI